MKAHEITDALDRRYGQVPDGKRRNTEQWVAIREARSGAGFDGNRRQCDYLAINTWQGQGLQLIGHEIKVSAADWRRELEQPEKAEDFARFCRRWWIVMPSKLARECKPEVPPAWGLMSVSDKGRVTEVVKAPARDPEPVPVWWWIGWLAQVDRRDRRATDRHVEKLISERLEEQRERMEKSINRSTLYSKESHDRLVEQVRKFRDATGIDIQHSWLDEWRQLSDLWHIVRTAPRFDVLVKHLRTAADGLERLEVK